MEEHQFFSAAYNSDYSELDYLLWQMYRKSYMIIPIHYIFEIQVKREKSFTACFREK